MCKRPFVTYAGEFGCGRCLPCKINHRRLWTSRLLLEQLGHGDSCFITLTYADVPDGHHGPPAPWVWSLQPAHLRNFLKRLRKSRGSFRYFAVGEYGDKKGRAHFHAALFGVSILEGEAIFAAWGHGSIHVGDLTRQSAGYISGYVTKKMTKADDERLFGRHPEFSRASNRPGIGAWQADYVAAKLIKLGDYGDPDVPAEVHMDGRKFPWGKYLRQRIRKSMGFPVQAPPEVHRRMAEKRKLDTIDNAAITARANNRCLSAITAENRVKELSSRKKL